MIKIRLSFTSENEKEAALKVLAESFDLISISKDYHNNDNTVFRVYVDAELKKDGC